MVIMRNYNINADSNGMFYIGFTKRGSIQFCITYTEDLSLNENYVIIVKDFVLPYYSTYVPPPFIYKYNPPLTTRLDAEVKKQHYKVEFDNELFIENKETEIILRVDSTEPDVFAIVENATYSYGKILMPGFEERTSTIIEFDFTPDGTYQSYLTICNIIITNAKGKKSNKIPNAILISVSFPISISCPTLAAGYVSNNAFVVSVPTLSINQNSDIFEYGPKDTSASALDIRLIATIPNDEKRMNLNKLVTKKLYHPPFTI